MTCVVFTTDMRVDNDNPYGNQMIEQDQSATLGDETTSTEQTKKNPM